MLRPGLALVLLLATPLASAQQETLEDLEVPHEGTDRVWSVTVAGADELRAIVLRGNPGRPFTAHLTV